MSSLRRTRWKRERRCRETMKRRRKRRIWRKKIESDRDDYRLLRELNLTEQQPCRAPITFYI